MDVEKLGKKKRSAERKSGFESDDDEPIGMMLVKSRKNAKKVKVEGDGGLDDTLATFRKKLKKGSRVRAPKRGDLDADVKVTNSDAKLETLAEEVDVDGDMVVESVEKEDNKKSERRDLDTDVKKTDSAAKLEMVSEEVNVSEDVIVESVKKEKNKRSKRRDLDTDVKNSDLTAKLETVAEANVSGDVIAKSVKKEKNKKSRRGDLDANVKNTDLACYSVFQCWFNGSNLNKLTVHMELTESETEIAVNAIFDKHNNR